MTTPAQPRPQSPTLTPIRKELELPCPPGDAFRMFTAEIGEWWPLATHTVLDGKALGCGIDTQPGGKIYETAPDGTHHVWGTILAFEPPGRVAFTFHPGRDVATAGTVEVRFSPSGSGCRVVLEHSGWELLGPEGPKMRQGYDQGWGEVFGRRYYEHCLRAR